MHGLPTIVVMNMTDEQREEYNRQESARIAKRKAVEADNRMARTILVTTCIIVVAVFALAFTI